LSRYFWPNPKKKDGLPYIRKDGQTNPEVNGVNFDRRRSQEMTNAVRDLSLAAYFSDDKRYANKAVRLAYTWFVDKERRSLVWRLCGLVDPQRLWPKGQKEI